MKNGSRQKTKILTQQTAKERRGSEPLFKNIIVANN
jgi:hypothetical protein